MELQHFFQLDYYFDCFDYESYLRVILFYRLAKFQNFVKSNFPDVFRINDCIPHLLSMKM
jgi:hypothetical protein